MTKKVKLLQARSGPKINQQRGDVIEIDDDEAYRMRCAGQCEYESAADQKAHDDRVKKDAADAKKAADAAAAAAKAKETTNAKAAENA